MSRTKKDKKHSFNEGRRTFMKGVLVGGAGAAVGTAFITAAVTDIYQVVKDTFVSNINEKRKYNDDILLYFTPKGEYNVEPASIGCPLGKTYSNEESAINSIFGLYDKINKEGKKPTRIVTEPYSSPFEMSRICIGGSGTNPWTRFILGHPDEPLFNKIYSVNEKNIKIDIPFSIKKLGGERIIRRMQDGMEHVSFKYSIVTKDQMIAIPAPVNNKLDDDFLLLTRLPLSILGGHDVIILAGLHGPAIRGIEHLLYNLDMNSLNSIKKKVKPGQPFQAIFHCQGIKDKDKDYWGKSIGTTSMPENITLYSEDYVVPIKFPWV